MSLTLTPLRTDGCPRGPEDLRAPVASSPELSDEASTVACRAVDANHEALEPLKGVTCAPARIRQTRSRAGNP